MKRSKKKASSKKKLSPPLRVKYRRLEANEEIAMTDVWTAQGTDPHNPATAIMTAAVTDLGKSAKEHGRDTSGTFWRAIELLKE